MGSAPAVLGIDAAWTVSEPSGVALWHLTAPEWKCLRVAPSYASFCGGAIDWTGEVLGGSINVPAILETCRQLLGGRLPTVVTASIPLARVPIKGRRPCDTMINRRFSQRKCAIEGPTSRRPGAVGLRLHQGFKAAGFDLVTMPGKAPAASLVEVYPHVAMLGVMRRAQRVPYKALNTQTYWPGLSALARGQLLIQQWRAILWRLGKYAGAIDVPLPKSPESWTFVRLKRFENAIDALVCAWMGAEFLNGRVRPLGDATAAIWIPQSAVRDAKSIAAG